MVAKGWVQHCAAQTKKVFSYVGKNLEPDPVHHVRSLFNTCSVGKRKTTGKTLGAMTRCARSPSDQTVEAS